MTNASALLVVVVGLAVSTWSAIVEIRAAGRRVIPLWKPEPGYRRPTRSVLLQLLAVLIVGIGATGLTTGGVSLSMLVLPLVFVPPLVAAATHNRRLSHARVEPEK